jgi:hypothetical protein
VHAYEFLEHRLIAIAVTPERGHLTQATIHARSRGLGVRANHLGFHFSHRFAHPPWNGVLAGGFEDCSSRHQMLLNSRAGKHYLGFRTDASGLGYARELLISKISLAAKSGNGILPAARHSRTFFSASAAFYLFKPVSCPR